MFPSAAPAPSHPSRVDDDRQRQLAWVATIGIAGVILVTSAFRLEFWPLSGYKLFSGMRTDTTTSTALVAIDHDGREIPVAMDPRNPVMVITSRQYADVLESPAPTRRTMIDSWLNAAHIDPAGIDSVRLDRMTYRIDPSTLTRTEISRSTVGEATR